MEKYLRGTSRKTTEVGEKKVDKKNRGKTIEEGLF